MIRKNILTGMILFLVYFSTSAQTSTEKLLIGKWNYSKTVDNNDEEIVITANSYIGSDGKKSKLISRGPNITFDENYTYVSEYKNAYNVILENGNWRLKNDEIRFEIIVFENTNHGLLKTLAESTPGKNREINAKGDYLDVMTYSIISLKENELRIKYDNELVQVYYKN